MNILFYIIVKNITLFFQNIIYRYNKLSFKCINTIDPQKFISKDRKFVCKNSDALERDSFLKDKFD